MFTFNYQYDDGQGPVVVLLHGFMGCLENWADLRRQLRPQWRTMAIDLPGHGGTPIANFGAPDAFERLPAALEDLLDGFSRDSVHLLGYSMGGRVALALALRAPERFASLVLEGVSPGLETDEACVARQAD
ncbi:MAG: alpha/beta fold hydrolase, partial [Candidatus Marinimicrobia bacterium]|nr:alpha/beta fold hydrolase [Candidatus Neomarinimicrobiota bacterium]